jgi:small-conductance mechanosensitive channel
VKLSSSLFNRYAGFLLLAILLAALVAGQYLTRGGDAVPASGADATALVDETPLITARRLAAEARTPQEQQQAAQALRVADHEVDQAFETALRAAAADITPLKGEALEVSQKIALLEKKVQTEKQGIDDLTKAPPKALHQDDVAQQIALAQAQMDLDNDVLNDLRQDLIRLGADKHAKIQQALDEHEATLKQQVMPAVTNTDSESPESLPAKFRAFATISRLERDLRQANDEAINDAGNLMQRHQVMEKQTESASSQPTSDTGGAAAGMTIDAMHALSGQRKTMMAYDSRIHDEQQLAAIYQAWGQNAAGRKRVVLHGILVALAIIVAVLILVLLGIVLIRRRFTKKLEDRRRLGHLRIVAELLLELIGLAAILIVIFGPPQQMPAIIGLVTAGVTIVMKDFILAFIGWFPLMGKNGIRVGDWVEINGVSGEVVEIGMLRTVLLETGNWTDSGHPTGRRVVFMNSFAIEGRYFNFSTSGQWLWDELRVTVPKGDDAYNRIEAVRKLIADATQQDAEVAEREWRQATKAEALQGFTAAPAIDLRPAVSGIEVTVRYITRAQKRYEVRSSLYQELIRVLQYEGEPQAAQIAANSVP